MFDDRIDALPEFFERRLKEEGVRTIVIDGHTGAGKTTVASAFAERLRKTGTNCTEFNIDWYLVDRDKRHYREDPRMMDLIGWFDIERAASDLGNVQNGDITLMSYDRSTGRRSKTLTLSKLGTNDILIVEGLYGLRLTKTLELPCLRFFLSLTDDEIRKRLYARNTYIERARLEYEIENIYLPSMRAYEKYLQEKNISYTEIDVNNVKKVRTVN